LTAPLLVLVVFGSLDVGQYINVSQAVSNASRMGARLAARQATTSAETVETEIEEYLAAIGVPADAVTVTVRDEDGDAVTGNGLAAIRSGDAISVQVSVDFADVRRVSFLAFLNEASNASLATMRRE
jgi:Flp pilus assembly protein TadG